MTGTCANCGIDSNRIGAVGVPDSTVVVSDGGPRPNPGQCHVLICDQCRAFGHLRSGNSWLTVKRFIDDMLAKERADEAARRAEWIVA